MPIEIEAPDGSIVEFPDGTGDDVIRTAMMKAYPPPLQGADYAKGLARNVGQGLSLGFGDEITAAARAGVGALTGGGSYGDLYDKALGEERASIEQFSKENPGTALAANIGGAVATAPIMPLANVVRGVGAARTAANMGLNAAGYGAAAGFGAGEGDVANRLENAAETAVQSGLVGGGVGALVGRIGAKATPDAQAALAASRNQEIARAADRLGVTVPRAAATNPTVVGNAARGTAGAIQAMPIIGAPLQRASQEAVEQIDDLGTQIANAYAPGVTREAAGQTIKEAGQAWVGPGSRAVADRLYGSVERAIPEGSMFNLGNTRRIAQQIQAQDIAAASNKSAPALARVAEALNRPDGLTFAGLRELRTELGQAIDDTMLSGAGTARPALERLYGALSDDIATGVRQYGGQQGTQAWERANGIFRQIAERREQIAKVIGKNDAAKSPEAIVETMIGMAGSSGKADVQRLLALRRATGADAWDELSSAAIGRLGQGRDGNFNPIDFLKNYQKLSDNGRQVLFGSTGQGNLRQALDDLATVSNAYRDMQGAIARGSAPTNTALALGGFGYGAGVLPALALALKGNLFARIMAQPVRVRQVTALQRAMLNQAQGGNPNMTKLALMTLASGIAKDNNEDERSVLDRLTQALGSM